MPGPWCHLGRPAQQVHDPGHRTSAKLRNRKLGIQQRLLERSNRGASQPCHDVLSVVISGIPRGSQLVAASRSEQPTCCSSPSRWISLWVGGFEFTNPPPEITKDGIKPYPNKGARRLHSRTSFFYTATGITPAMSMRLTGVGSQYLIGNVDAAGEPFDGAKTYRLTLPKDIPAARFWSLTLYDNQIRSMLQTEQRYPGPAARSTPHPPRRPSLIEADHWGSVAVAFDLVEEAADKSSGHGARTWARGCNSTEAAVELLPRRSTTAWPFPSLPWMSAHRFSRRWCKFLLQPSLHITQHEPAHSPH